MSRIRSIKPEFWQDEDIGALSVRARLLFIATWNLADDAGRLRWTPEYIKASAFCYDAVSVRSVKRVMDELVTAGKVVPYEGGQTRQRLGLIVNFPKHQRIDKPQPSRLPPPPDSANDSTNDSTNDSGNDSAGLPNGSQNDSRPDLDLDQGSGSKDQKLAAKTAPRPRDLAWEAFVSATNTEPAELSADRRNALNGMLGGLRRRNGMSALDAGEQADEIELRGSNCPWGTPTPEQLVRHWAEWGSPPQGPRRPPPRDNAKHLLARATEGRRGQLPG